MPKSRSKKKSILPAVAVLFFSFLMAVILLFTTPIQLLELKFNDKLFEWRGPLPTNHSPIVMVAMSDEADEEIPEKYPWPTSVYAKLVQNLNEAGAKVIIFDVFFDNPDLYNRRNDTLFAEAIREYGNVILAGDIRIQEDEYSDEIIRMFPQAVLNTYNPNPVGLVRVFQGLDGAVRSYKFGVNSGGEDHYTLALEGLRLFENLSYDEVESLNESLNSGFFKIGTHFIPKDRANSFLINYYGPENSFPVISLETVIDDANYKTVFEAALEFDINTFDNEETGLLHQDIFRDKIVIIGSTMPLLKDFYFTPFANEGDLPRPGYEIHAHAIQTILDDNYIIRQNGWWGLFLMFLFPLTIVAVNRFFSAFWGIISTTILGGAFIFISYLAFVHANYLMLITGPILSLLLGQITMTGVEFFIEQKEKRRIKGMFSSYVSPELVERMVESGQEPQLGGEETFITAFFSDIEAFSTFSEQLEPKQLVQIMNEYLSAMTDILHDQGGTLDKYIGDAIVAFFGAPVHLEDHAYKACEAILLMQNELGELRRKWKEEGHSEIVYNMHHRIGLNSGLMITGNMGSTRRFNYTMMGDNVNLAARCESASKQYGVYSLVAESTKLEAEKYSDNILYRQIDNIIVKGRIQPVKIYEVMAFRNEADDDLLTCVELFERALNHYFNREWDKAISTFKLSAELEKFHRNPSNIFMERCQIMKSDPPNENWDGVFIMKKK